MPAPFLRVMLVLLAIGQYFMRAATLPPRSVLNQPKGSPRDAKALRVALKQQLTPSCCAQLLQRVAPGLWAVMTTQALSPDNHTAIIQDEGDMCITGVTLTLGAIGGMCRGCTPSMESFYALGELQTPQLPLQGNVSMLMPMTMHAASLLSPHGIWIYAATCLSALS
jgi:hypothetical protein